MVNRVGTECDARLPSPNCPLEFAPHTHSDPSLARATTWASPADTALTCANVAIGAGNERAVVVPSPRLPRALLPHAHRLPSAVIARLKSRPAATLVTLLKTATGAGAV